MVTFSERRVRLSSAILIAAGAAVLGGAVTAMVIDPPFAASSGAHTPGAGNTATASPEAPAMPDLARRIEGDPTALGSVDAPVVMIEYADYRCPFCSLFARETLPDIIDQYVADGTLRIEWRDLPIFGEQSIATAVAARSAGEQGLFWEYSAAVHAAAPEKGHPEIDRAKLIEFATQIGVPDLAAFEAGLDSEVHHAAVQADLREAQSIGATSTPIFLIGQEAFAGAQPLEMFQAAIERQAAK